MKIVAIIQARIGSTRLPGKVLKNLAGKTVLARVLERLQCAKSIDEVIVATSVLPQDDVIVAECERLKIHCFRGSEKNVLQRYYQAAQQYQADIIVRVTADCPLFDGFLLETMLQKYKAFIDAGENVDYMSNVIKRTFPQGLDAEIFCWNTLERCYKEATEMHQLEHVTPYIYENADNVFSIRNFAQVEDFSHYRWTLDTPEDYQFMQSVYNCFADDKGIFTTNDLMQLLAEKPDMILLNK